MNLISLLRLMKEFSSINKLRFKLRSHFLAYVVAARVHARPDRGDDVPSHCPKMSTHVPHTLFDNSFHRAPPARMKDAHCMGLLVDQDDGQYNPQFESPATGLGFALLVRRRPADAPEPGRRDE